MRKEFRKSDVLAFQKRVSLPRVLRDGNPTFGLDYRTNNEQSFYCVFSHPTGFFNMNYRYRVNLIQVWVWWTNKPFTHFSDSFSPVMGSSKYRCIYYEEFPVDEEDGRFEVPRVRKILNSCIPVGVNASVRHVLEL